MSNENRRYITFDLSEVDQIDFSQVEETSNETLRVSVDLSKSVVKYNLPQPSSIAGLTTKSAEKTHSEILIIMGTSEWSSPMPI